NGAAEVDSLRTHLTDLLPGYMVPAAYVRLDRLPLTPSGKVDRRALPAPEGDAYARRAYEAPVGEAERTVAEIWGEVLGIDRVGRWDDFFELGGHSLLAVRVISRVRESLAVGVTLERVFQRPVLAAFAEGVDETGRAVLPAVTRRDPGAPVPLSYAQQRLWFLDQMGDPGWAYRISHRMRFHGDLDRAALERALGRIVERHEALRTLFEQVDGEPRQRVVPVAEHGLAFTFHDLTGRAEALAGVLMEEARSPFDLAAGPLFRCRLVRLAGDEHVLLVSMHHIVSDAWSTGVLIRELNVLYEAFRRGDPDPLPELPVQYADYAVWQRRWIDGEVLEAQEAYWRETLRGAPDALSLPTDHARPEQPDFAGATVEVVLDEALTAGLRTLGRRHGTTLFMTLMAGWATVLSRLSGQTDVTIGTPTANRGRTEIEGLLGFFVNTLAVRMELGGSPTVAELLERVKARTLGAQQHQDLPFERVVEAVRPTRSLTRHPLFQVLFAWQTARREPAGLPGLTGAPVRASVPESARYDLSLSLREVGGRVRGVMLYPTALFDAATVQRYVGYLVRVLEQMVADDGRPVERLEILPPAERRQVVDEWNDTDADFPRELCIHEMMEAHAERTPHAPALRFEARELTYAQLNARANRLAHHLRGLGVGPDARVAICVERGVEMVVGMLGVLKAGGAYVPLDPTYPADRLRFMLEDSAPAVVLTQARLAGELQDAGVPVLMLDAPVWEGESAANPGRAGLTSAHPAYVIYTSGSTGRPKGVVVEHRQVANLLTWAQRVWGLAPDDAVLQRISFSFDVSVRECLWPLSVGARLVLATAEGHKDPRELVASIRRDRVRAVHFPVAMLQAFLEEPGSAECTTLAHVISGGEALPAAVVERFRERLPHAELHHMYGPTETTVGVTRRRCEPGEATGRIPLGRPVANSRLYVLDDAGQPVPAGVVGELYVGGAQVARGYLGRPALTAEKFVPDPFGTEAGARLYRTGDLGRWAADGTLEFIGREDAQVKVRGFRIELGEIEARLAEHPALRNVVVVVRNDAAEPRVVAYYVGSGDVAPDALRAHAAERLPEYMVPAAFVALEALPLTPTGKVDARALPAPEGDAFATRAYEAPEGETETALAEIWTELLGVDRVGRNDHFFDLGGHSLLATRLVLRIREQLLIDFALRDVFAAPTLAQLAERMLDAQLAQYDPDELERLLGESPGEWDGATPNEFPE
ncbi:MAG TPA: amino acid adenylation domain-containing protein, partial [Longimicrobium sp.]|nr:amino acid adenylation domain-containing protein [Longimicrobium sp.]